MNAADTAGQGLLGLPPLDPQALALRKKRERRRRVGQAAVLVIVAALIAGAVLFPRPDIRVPNSMFLTGTCDPLTSTREVLATVQLYNAGSAEGTVYAKVYADGTFLAGQFVRVPAGDTVTVQIAATVQGCGTHEFGVSICVPHPRLMTC